MTDTHQYQVIIYTGIRRNAGTTANVGLMLSGDFGRSRKCLLKSSKREVLKRGHVDSFLITTTGSLGPLDYLHIWHDNTGSNPAWFLNRVVVLDSETGRVENFLCYRWLAVDEGDGQIQRLLPIADAQDLKTVSPSVRLQGNKRADRRASVVSRSRFVPRPVHSHVFNACHAASLYC